MHTYEEYRSLARHADAEAAGWEKRAIEAEESVKRFRQYAKNRRRDAADYRDLADRNLSEINASLEGVAA